MYGKGAVIGRTRMQTTADNYINKVLARFAEGVVITEDITDRVFLMIRENTQLYRKFPANSARCS